MTSLLIEGETLGEIHHKYNKLVNDAIKNKNVEITEINYDDSDFDNLFKIDIASKNRDVEYILKVLQCTDMLYVSRAIKKSPWLITDKQYSHVINPEYLFNELSLQMTSKALNKLILQVRLLLRDEERVEDFYNYYKERDLNTALKWLPHCSQSFIEKIVEKHANDKIDNNLIKRLCEKSIAVLDIYCRFNKKYDDKRKALFKAMFVIRSDVERYLDIVELLPYDTPTFSDKYTKIMMTKCRDRIMEKLDRYADYIDVPTFSKFIPEKEIKDFLFKNIKNLNLRSWVRNQKIKHLIYKLPSDDRFQFTKKIFIDKERNYDHSDDDSMLVDAVPYRCVQMSCGNSPLTSQNIYTWYIFAPFETAFTDLKKYIRAESNPSERIAILTVLLITAGNNMENIHTLLKYYREHHINEPFKFKIQFINIVLSKTKAYRYDKNTWLILKDIFSSMEVYSESDKNVQSCVRAVLMYCIINDETVPEIIDKKFELETLKQHKTNLTQDEQNKIFNYLFKSVCSKIQTDKIQNEKEYEEMIGILENALTLLCDWNKDLKDYPTILEEIKKLIEMKRVNPGWDVDITILYRKTKWWKELQFKESLLVSPAQDTVMNALKHDSKQIEKYKNKILELLRDDKNLDFLFKKIRIYWSQSLAISFKRLLIDNLHQSYNHKYFITGLCTLLPHKELTDIKQKYVPSKLKIDWSEHDEVQLFIRKNLAMNLYLARPQPSLDMALLYAKGDYLQYALPSLNAILYNMRSVDVHENIKTLLTSSVSLQKHGIRTAILKLKSEDLKQILSEIWKSNKNISIRANIFVHNHKMLCKEKNEQSIKEIWDLIKMLIDNLTPDEDKQIYTTLSKVEKVPMSIRGEYWMKSYEFFNSLPVKANCDSLLDHLTISLANIMQFLNSDFLANIFVKLLDKKYRSNSSIRADIFVHSHNMLCEEKNENSINIKWELIKMFIDNLTQDEDKQIYSKLSDFQNVPMCIRGKYWMKSYEFFNSLPAKSNCRNLLDHLIRNMTSIMLYVDDDFVVNILMTSFDKEYCTQDYTYAEYVATFLLSAKTEEAQMKHYKKCLVPMFEKSFPVWDKQHEGVYHVRKNIYKIIEYLSYRFDIVVYDDMVLPIKMFTEILETLQNKTTQTENYILMTVQKLSLTYITIMDKVVREEKEKNCESAFRTMTNYDLLNLIYEIVTVDFGKACVEHLKEDIANNLSSIYVYFAEAFNIVYGFYDLSNNDHNHHNMNKLRALDAFLEDKDFFEGYLLVVEILPEYLYADYQKTLIGDLLNKISEHPNKEIQMHYSVLLNWKDTKYFYKYSNFSMFEFP